MYLWHDDRYWSLSKANIKPVLSGTVIETVFLQFPEKEFPVNGKEAQAVLNYALRNNVSSLVSAQEAPKTQFAVQVPASANGGKEKKRKFTAQQIEVMSQKRKEYWADPERGGKRRKKKAPQEEQLQSEQS